MKKIQNSISNFFSWLSKTELVELDSVDITEDPIRPEYDNEFRNSHGRKIYGLKSNENIEGFICIAFCNDVPQTMKELDLMSKNAFHENPSLTTSIFFCFSKRQKEFINYNEPPRVPLVEGISPERFVSNSIASLKALASPLKQDSIIW